MTQNESNFAFVDNAWKASWMVLLAAFLSVSTTAMGQRDDESPADVLEYMTYHLGRWQSNTTYFDAEGNVTKEAIEGYGEKVLVEGQVNLHFSYNADGTVNTAFRFYSPEDDKLYMIDVTAQGRWWILSGSRGDNVQYSHEQELADGRKVILRLTHSNIRADAFDALSEVSFDGGDRWRKTSLQKYRKIGDEAER